MSEQTVSANIHEFHHTGWFSVDLAGIYRQEKQHHSVRCRRTMLPKTYQKATFKSLLLWSWGQALWITTWLGEKWNPRRYRRCLLKGVKKPTNVTKTKINHPPVISIFIGAKNHSQSTGWLIIVFTHMGVGQNLLVSILMGWTSIYQLFWGSLGARVLINSHINNSSHLIPYVPSRLLSPSVEGHRDTPGHVADVRAAACETPGGCKGDCKGWVNTQCLDTQYIYIYIIWITYIYIYTYPSMYIYIYKNKLWGVSDQ